VLVLASLGLVADLYYLSKLK